MMPARPNRPSIFLRGGVWCCIVKGDSRSRMGNGDTPLAAYRSWEFWNSAMGVSVARAVYGQSAAIRSGS